MIETRLIRTLDLAAPFPPLTAASGLVRVGEFLYVIGDDENHLGAFHWGDLGPGKAIPLFPGDLPEEKSERKRLKPDLEALTFLPAERALLALPSGSKTNRSRGALIPVDMNGAVAGPASVISFDWLFEYLRNHFDPPNLESIALVGDNVYLIHRGNKSGHRDRLITIPYVDFMRGQAERATLSVIENVGAIEGVPITVTDAAALDNKRLVFTAVAERTQSSYDDGPCLGAGIGIMDLQGQIKSFNRIAACKKLEGIYAEVHRGRIRLLLVNDEDDRTKTSELLETEI